MANNTKTRAVALRGSALILYIAFALSANLRIANPDSGGSVLPFTPMPQQPSQGGRTVMSLEIEGSVEQIRSIVMIKGISIGRATPEVRPGVRVVYATLYRVEALEEIRAVGATVRVLKTEAQLRDEAQRDHNLTRAAEEARRALTEPANSKDQGKGE